MLALPQFWWPAKAREVRCGRGNRADSDYAKE
jgi:hypothetical protein